VKITRWTLTIFLLFGAIIVLSLFTRGKDQQTYLFADEGGLESSLQSQVYDPSSDVPGRDLKTVPRYPKSVRVFYGRERTGGKRSEAFLVMYRCQDTLRAVSSFYEAELPKYGWVLAVKDETAHP